MFQSSAKLSSASFTFVDVNDPSKEVQLGQSRHSCEQTNGPISYDPDRQLRNWKMQDMN